MPSMLDHHHTGIGPLPLLLATVLVAYWLAAARQRRLGRRWSLLRGLSFALRLSLLALAFTPAVSAFAHHDMRGHMLQHLLLGMFAPLPLVLAAPGTLLLRTVPARAARAGVRFLARRPVRALIHPFTALLLDMGGMYLLYLTPLYALSLDQPLPHALVHAHFLIAGYLFTWAIAGPDPAPHRPGLRLRLAVLFLGGAAHAILAKLMYAYHWPRGTPHSLEQIQAAAQWMYYGGDAAELLLAVAFFSIWFRRRASGSAVGRRERHTPGMHLDQTSRAPWSGG